MFNMPFLYFYSYLNMQNKGTDYLKKELTTIGSSLIIAGSFIKEKIVFEC